MPIVSNTSPILNLAMIGHLELLRQQFAEVLIPSAVRAELKPETAFPGASVVQQALQAQWLRVAELKDAHLVRALALDLDEGEAAAIALALELGMRRILMDEHDGRVKARALGLEPIGLLGVLLRAKRDGTLDSVEVAMQMLRQQAGFFVADDLFAQVLREAGERL
jgi:predicted nucleic acid-binding protein